jgi:hypothetical protein
MPSHAASASPAAIALKHAARRAPAKLCRQPFVNEGGRKSSRRPIDGRHFRCAGKLERAVSEIREDSSQNATEIEVVDAKERWSEYRLADGTTMRIKSVVIAVFRDDSHQTPDGEPVYNMKSTLITDVRASAGSPRPGT